MGLFGGRGMRIATGALRPRNDRGFCKGAVKRAVGDAGPYGGVIDGAGCGGVSAA